MSYYRIAYSDEYYQKLSDDELQPLKYIDDYTLYDMEIVTTLIEEEEKPNYPFDDDINVYTEITDRSKAVTYIKANRKQYQYIGFDTGRIDNIICVEISDNGKSTAALYQCDEQHYIWLRMY